MAPTTVALLARHGGVCDTPACHSLSQTLLTNTNLNIDPCSDFFQFSCGNWVNTDEVKEQTSSYSVVEQIEMNGLHTIIAMLNGTYSDLSKMIYTNDTTFHTEDEASIDEKNFELAKNYYDLCLDTTTRSQLGATPIFQYIAQLENELFPLEDTLDPKKLAQTLAASTLQQIPTVLNAQVIQNPLDLTQNLAYLGLPVLDETVTYSDIDSLNTYKTFLVDLLDRVLAGSSSDDSVYDALVVEESRKNNFTLWSPSKIKSAVSETIDFEVQLSSILTIPETDFKSFPTLESLEKISTTIDWRTFFSLVAPDASLKNLTVAYTIEQISAIDALIAETSVKALQSFWIVSTVKARASNLKTGNTASFRAPTTRDPATLTTQEICGGETSKKFKQIMGRFFTLATFGASAEKKIAEDFVDMLHFTWLNDMLPHTSWIGEETKKTVIDKVKAIRKRVVYSTTSPDWQSPRALETFYKGLTNETVYLEAVHLYTRWQSLQNWKKISVPVDENEWNEQNYPEMFNALYNPTGNLIEIPIGVFQEPVYNTQYPEYVNYGNLGAIIGHELTHSLDSSGRFYDKKGYPADLFTKEDSATYEKKSQCFIDQFDKFSLQDANDKLLPLNGTNVLGENIADSGGLKISHAAYQNYIKKRGSPEKILPGFEKYTPEQLFFLSHAQFTCATVQKKVAQSLIDQDVHAPLYFRNIGAFQNSAEFAKAFNCPAGSPMNPKKEKCSVW